MATRIEIEITSDRGDGTYTWRAAGAKQPKGSFEAGLLPEGASVGDVLRAEAEFTVDGPELISIAPPREVKPDTIERIVVTGSGKDDQGGVTTQLAKKGRSGSGGRGRSRGRQGGRSQGGRSQGGRSGGKRREHTPTLKPAKTHREKWIASIAENLRPVAEQLMYEGRDGVLDAMERQNSLAVSEGRDPIDTKPIMKIADQLLPDLNIANCRDHVDAAIAQSDSADIRELRKTYISGLEYKNNADVAQSLETLRSKINQRVTSDQGKWAREIREALTEGRVVRALRNSGRPAKAGAPLPDDLVNQLQEAALSALSSEEESYRWISVLEALAGSPVRRLVTPEAKPETVEDDLLDTVDRLAHLIPGVADLFGVAVTPNRRS